MKQILVLNGPNLNLLGRREPHIYGHDSLPDINAFVGEQTAEYSVALSFFQSNHEGQLIDRLHTAMDDGTEGVVINPGALTHYSIALRDAISSISLPTVEVHLSDINQREGFRRISVLREVCIDQVSGFGKQSYVFGIEALLGHAVWRQVDQVAAGKPAWHELLKNAVHLLHERFPKYDWTGIYLVEGDELVVDSYLGAPTPHERIPIGQGICGAAVAERDTIIVPDVNADPRYLACSIETKSEIVVPIYDGEVIIGEIDIDSHRPDAFKAHDRRYLERIAAVLGRAKGAA